MRRHGVALNVLVCNERQWLMMKRLGVGDVGREKGWWKKMSRSWEVVFWVLISKWRRRDQKE
jgi:hypothetical protein